MCILWRRDLGVTYFGAAVSILCLGQIGGFQSIWDPLFRNIKGQIR